MSDLNADDSSDLNADDSSEGSTGIIDDEDMAVRGGACH